MKTIYVNNYTLKEAVDYINDEITFFGFLSNVKIFLKELLTNPLNADINDYLKRHGNSREMLINDLLNHNIIEKETKIEDKDGIDKFLISYKVPKRNFERKMKRLYISLYEKNEISENLLHETDCGGAMQGGGANPDAGQYTQPFGKVQRRKIYLTQEQSKFLKETGIADVGNFQYDVPMNFNNGNDESFNHSNLINNGIPKKKKGVRNKSK